MWELAAIDEGFKVPSTAVTCKATDYNLRYKSDPPGNVT